jgi:NAD(P)H-flavin reductase
VDLAHAFGRVAHRIPDRVQSTTRVFRVDDEIMVAAIFRHFLHLGVRIRDCVDRTKRIVLESGEKKVKSCV